MKTNSKKDSAVSPVIGTILLVAITVVLVAIISAVVMGMTGNVGTTYTVGVQISSNASNAVLVTLTGGADYTKLKNISLVYDGTAKEGATTKSPIGVPEKFTVTGTGKSVDVSVLGYFEDGTTQTIYTGKLLVLAAATPVATQTQQSP